eukprot:1142646-Pelagomonas_calceolata.AAC.11
MVDTVDRSAPQQFPQRGSPRAAEWEPQAMHRSPALALQEQHHGKNVRCTIAQSLPGFTLIVNAGWAPIPCWRNRCLACFWADQAALCPGAHDFSESARWVMVAKSLCSTASQRTCNQPVLAMDHPMEHWVTKDMRPTCAAPRPPSGSEAWTNAD